MCDILLKGRSKGLQRASYCRQRCDPLRSRKAQRNLQRIVTARQPGNKLARFIFFISVCFKILYLSICLLTLQALIENNAKVGADIALELARLSSAR